MAQPSHFKFPLFPLSTVLYPGALLPLRIFEPRYLRMISDCLKRERGFVVCLISSGRETGQAANFHPIGTVAKIIDWDDTQGLLQVTCEGDRRVQVLNSTVADDQLVSAEAVYLEREMETGISVQDQPLAEMVARFFNQQQIEIDDEQLCNASWISFRLAQLLPLSPSRKQWLLELTNPTLRLSALAEDIQHLRSEDKLPGPLQ